MTKNYVDGWDDPRLMTLAGLRRRGVTSAAINAFVRGIGITRRSKIHILISCTCYMCNYEPVHYMCIKDKPSFSYLLGLSLMF